MACNDTRFFTPRQLRVKLTCDAVPWNPAFTSLDNVQWTGKVYENQGQRPQKGGVWEPVLPNLQVGLCRGGICLVGFGSVLWYYYMRQLLPVTPRVPTEEWGGRKFVMEARGFKSLADLIVLCYSFFMSVDQVLFKAP